jgi:hypothetical protein
MRHAPLRASLAVVAASASSCSSAAPASAMMPSDLGIGSRRELHAALALLGQDR